MGGLNKKLCKCQVFLLFLRMRKDIAELIELYEKGFSCSKIAKIKNISRQSVWESLNRRGVLFRKNIELPYIMYDGLKFTISKTTGYYRLTTSRKNHVSLHRYIWEKEVGKIEFNHDIHHIDGDKTNNKISNLMSIDKAEHTLLHHKQRKNGK